MEPMKPEERKRLAEQYGINEQYLYQCLTGRRDMNPSEAMRLELASGGALTRQMLCQKTAALIWPELANAKPGDTSAARAHAYALGRAGGGLTNT